MKERTFSKKTWLFYCILLLAFLLCFFTACLNRSVGSADASDITDELPMRETQSLQTSLIGNPIAVAPAYLELAKSCIITVDADTEQAIQDAFMSQYGLGMSITKIDDEGRYINIDMVCYGEFDGCVVLMLSGNTFEPVEVTIDGVSFWWPAGMTLYAYRDGEILKLQAAYEMEWLNKEALTIAAERHKNYFIVDQEFVYLVEDVTE